MKWMIHGILEFYLAIWGEPHIEMAVVPLLKMFSNSSPGHISEKNKSTNLKRYIHPDVHSTIIYSCQDMEAT